MIYGPDGRPLVKAIAAGDEGILSTEIDLRDIDYAKGMIDTVGHYSRPDLLSLLVNPKAAQIITEMK
jgi:nitrilase